MIDVSTTVRFTKKRKVLTEANAKIPKKPTLSTICGTAFFSLIKILYRRKNIMLGNKKNISWQNSCRISKLTKDKP